MRLEGLGEPPDLLLPLGKDEVPLVLLHEVHLVDEAEDLGLGRVLEDGLQARLVVVHVLLQLAGLHIEHVDQDLDGNIQYIFHSSNLPQRNENI